MALHISTEDGAAEYGTIYLYWRRFGIEMAISTGYAVVDYRTVDLYWGRCGRVGRCRSLLVSAWRYISLLTTVW